MRKLTRKLTSFWLLTMAVSLLTGITAAQAATDFDTILAKAEEFVTATAEVEAANEGKEEADQADLPEWSAYVADDANTAWATIKDGAGEDGGGDKLNALSAEANQAIYDNVWTSADALTPWLVHNIWVLIAAFLVFLMHLGFCSLESGLCQKKNTVNILFKNCWIIATGILTYYFWGFNAHYPGFAEDSAGFFAAGSIASYGPNELLTHATNIYHDSYTWWTDFIFQAMFAATAATIVSGAVAERVKLTSFMIFAVILVGFAYPWVGSWHWGGGLLASMDFYDFAGSTVVHAFGGFAALACVLVLGPRKGKYTADGTKPILGHSMPLAAIGVFLLFFGWFGFNGGSVLAAEPHLVSLVIVATSLAAVGGALGSIVLGWIILKKPDLSMALNGFLAGLVGITAGPDVISPTAAIFVGIIAGALVVVSILFFDKVKVDDPVGAISVHGVCGIWGTLAVGIFSADHSVFTQLKGCLLVCAVAFTFSYVVFLLIKMVMGVRVDEEEEYEGLDIAEHGAPAYTD